MEETDVSSIMETRPTWLKSLEVLHDKQLEESLGPSGTDNLKQKLAGKAAGERRKLLKSKSQIELFKSDLGLDLCLDFGFDDSLRDETKTSKVILNVNS